MIETFLTYIYCVPGFAFVLFDTTNFIFGYKIQKYDRVEKQESNKFEKMDTFQGRRENSPADNS